MPENTASRLKQIMDLKGLRQSDVLRMAQPFCEEYDVKLGKSDLSQFVSGKTNPGQWKLTILGMALNVSEAWLMGFDVPMDRDAALIDTSSLLSPAEEQLLTSFRSLNTEGREKVLAYTEDLTRAGIYKKFDQFPVDTKEA